MQKIKLVSLAITTAIAAASATAQVNHTPRGLGMGGVGVAVSDISSAAFYNPSLVSSSKYDEAFSVVIPSLSLNVSDPDNFIEAFDDFKDGEFIDELSTSIDNAMLPGSFSSVADNAEALSRELGTLDGKYVAGGGGVYAALTIPSRKFGFALSTSARVSLGGVINYDDADLLENLSSDLRDFDACLEDNFLAPGSCLPTDLNLSYINPLTGDILFDADEDLLSSVELYGLGVGEIGLTVSTSLSLSEDSSIAFGLTPKIVQVEIFDYIANVDSAELDNFNSGDYVVSQSDFNVDVGLLVQLSDHWSVGLAVKDVISKDYETERYGVKTGRVVQIEPRATAGVSYDNGWALVALDVDTTKTAYVNHTEQQIIAIGAEIDVLGLAQVRAGYSHDLQSVRDDRLSAGVGFSPFGVHFDVGVSGNKNELVVAGQMGFKW